METRAQILLTLLLLVSLPRASVGQTIAFQDTVFRVAEIPVKGERPSPVERLGNRPAFITIRSMDETSRRMASTAEYLAQTVGFHVKSTGGYGAYSTASIRGSSAKQVSVFLDGIPLLNSPSGLVDLADLPLSSLSRIEVYRGAGVFGLSGSNIGGVVNLVTENPSEEDPGEVSVSLGSLSTRRCQAKWSFSPADWHGLLLGRALSTAGDFDFLDDNGTPFNNDDDQVTQRTNNHLEEREFFLKLSRPLGRGTVSLANQFYHRRQGLPGYGAHQSPTEALRKTYNLLHITWESYASLPISLRTTASLFWLHQHDLFQDRQPKTGTAKPDVTNRAQSVGGNLRWQLVLPRYRQSWRGMLEFRHEFFRPEETYTETTRGPRQSRRSVVLTLEDEIHLWPGRLRLVPSGRFESYTDRTRSLSRDTFLYSYLRNLANASVDHQHGLASIGLVAHAGPGLTLKANCGRFYRLPSLMELFGYRGMVEPNPTLRPESGMNSDVGLRWDRHTAGGQLLSIELAYFRSDMENLILYLYPTRQAAKALNIDRADVRGYELSFSLATPWGLSLTGNLTRLSAINTGPVSYARERYLPDRPELSIFGRAEWHRGRARAFYEIDHIEGNYWNAYNRTGPNNRGPARTRGLHATGMTVPTGLRQLDLALEAKNITDERVEDVMGYPMPGRAFFATLVLRWGGGK